MGLLPAQSKALFVVSRERIMSIMPQDDSQWFGKLLQRSGQLDCTTGGDQGRNIGYGFEQTWGVLWSYCKPGPQCEDDMGSCHYTDNHGTNDIECANRSY